MKTLFPYQRKVADWATNRERIALFLEMRLGKSLVTIDFARAVQRSGEDGRFPGVQIDKVDCAAETCTVTLRLTYDYLAPRGAAAAKGITTTMQETWVLDQGQASFVMQP